MSKSSETEVVIIGGGPAGLTAATYLARFRRRVAIIDAGGSRTMLIPCSHNYPGFPEGVAGAALLSRMKRQAAHYGVVPITETVKKLEQIDEGFVVEWSSGNSITRCVLLATGVEDIKPLLTDIDDGVRSGHLHYCPLCDAYELLDKNVCILSDAPAGIHEALYLRHFTDRLTLIDLDGKANLSEDERAQLKAAGVAVRKISSSDVHLVDEHVHVPGEDKDTSDDLRFDAAYMMVGTAVRNELARSLGVGCDGEGYILTDRHQRTNIDGLYAAGDVAEGINQIAVAAGQAAIAASSIHMSLTKNYDK